MHTENLITEDDTLDTDIPENKTVETDEKNLEKPGKKKRKRHNSAMLAVAKARNEAIHRADNALEDGSFHPIGTNITYKNGGGIL
jgi:hypothetical protein